MTILGRFLSRFRMIRQACIWILLSLHFYRINGRHKQAQTNMARFEWVCFGDANKFRNWSRRSNNLNLLQYNCRDLLHSSPSLWNSGLLQPNKAKSVEFKTIHSRAPCEIWRICFKQRYFMQLEICKTLQFYDSAKIDNVRNLESFSVLITKGYDFLQSKRFYLGIKI